MNPPTTTLHRRTLRPRWGFTLLEAVVTIVVIGLMLMIATPFILQGWERVRRTGCEMNLVKLGKAVQAYETVHRVYPTGSRFQTNPDSPYGVTWWHSILPYADNTEVREHWIHKWTSTASSGDFNGPTPNPNTPFVDGLRPTAMYCPSSPLPMGNDPLRDMSEANRAMVPTGARGIPTPHYVAIAGSAPDMKNLDDDSDAPHGRNTRDGRYGILSASGMFPPNQHTYNSSLLDGAQFTIMLGEQSDWGVDAYYDPPLRYDLRSCWPGGAFMGAGGKYASLSPAAEGINGSGDERCLNITSVRYGINTKVLKPGIVAQPVTEIPAPPEGKPVKVHPTLSPGPGHNQGIFSAHPGGANVLMADGTTRWLADDTSLLVLRLLSTRDDRQLVPQK